MEPDNRIWYAVWNMELKNVPGTIVGDFCFKGLGKDGVASIVIQDSIPAILDKCKS